MPLIRNIFVTDQNCTCTMYKQALTYLSLFPFPLPPLSSLSFLPASRPGQKKIAEKTQQYDIDQLCLVIHDENDAPNQILNRHDDVI